MQRCLLLLLALVVGFLVRAATPGVAAVSGLSIPPEFVPLLSARGVKVYQQEAEDGAAAYVQVIDLSRGARLTSWQGPVVARGLGEGAYGGASPEIGREYIWPVYDQVRPTNPAVVCLSNGQYFLNTVDGVEIDPTELAFPLKVEDVVVSEGYGRYEYNRHKMMLSLWPDYASLTPLDSTAFRHSDAPTILSGLAPRVSVRRAEALGRMVVGIVDDNGDGRHEIVLIFSSLAATQAEAVSALRAFGASQLMMLDGGGSTQLLCKGRDLIFQARPLPQVLLTVAAPASAVADPARLALAACCRQQRQPGGGED